MTTAVPAVPAGWRKIPLGDLVRIGHGYAFKGQYFTENGTDAVVTPGNFQESGGFREVGAKQKFYAAPYPALYNLAPGDLIVAMTEQTAGLLGCAAFVPESGRWLHNQRIGKVSLTSNEVTLAYLFHVFNSESFRVSVSKTAAGTKVQHTSPEKLQEIDILLPPSPEQATISEAIGDADTQITAIERFIAKKIAIMQGVMQQLLTGRTRLAGFAAPWQPRKIEKLLLPRVDRYTGGDPLEVLSCTKHQGFVRSLDYFKNQVFSRNLAGYRIIRRGDIGYPANHVEEGSIGVQEAYDAALVSPIYVVMQPFGEIDTYFLQRQLKLDYFRQEFARVTNSSVNRRGSLRWEQFSQIEVLVPDVKEQRAVSRCLRDGEAELHVLQRRLAKAKAERQGMMQQLLTGRTRLPLREATS